MDIGVALWFGMVSDGYVCDMGVGFGLVMFPMDYNFERYLALYYITLLFTTEIALSYEIGFVPS